MSSLKELFRVVLAAVIALLVLSACSGGVVYDTYNHTPINGWDKGDTLFFDVPPVVEAGLYRQEIGLRTNQNFPFTGITFVLDRTVEPGHRVSSDTIRCRLTDNKGNTLGQGVSYYQYDFVVSEISLNKGDSLHVGIRHIMKREILPGVADLGLRLIKVQ